MKQLPSTRHYAESRHIAASPSEVFDCIDDHNRFSSHMNKSSLMMGGGQMHTYVDQQQGKAVGSHIKMDGTAFGIFISLDEVVTTHEPPHKKTWETVGVPKLIIIGRYQMTVEIQPEKDGSYLTITIDYDLPTAFPILGKLLSNWYAKWCVRQMLDGTQVYFAQKTHE
jgi:hypothetical protein